MNNNDKPKKRKSVLYNIVVVVLTIILSVSTFSLVVQFLLLKDDYNKIEAEDLYYKIVNEQYYSNFDFYNICLTNRINNPESDGELDSIYAYADYGMDAILYYGIKDETRKSKYEDKMKEDVERMGEISGLTDRVDRMIDANIK